MQNSQFTCNTLYIFLGLNNGAEQLVYDLGVEWGKTHTFWKTGSVSQSSEDNDFIPFPSDTSNIFLQNMYRRDSTLTSWDVFEKVFFLTPCKKAFYPDSGVRRP